MTKATASLTTAVAASASALAASYFFSKRLSKNIKSSKDDQDIKQRLSRASSVRSILMAVAPNIDPSLAHVLVSLAESTSAISHILANGCDTSAAGSQNASGDNQLVLDLACDGAAFRELRRCEGRAVAVAASEETPVVTVLHSDDNIRGKDGKRYAVGFDPLDGSSVIGANFTVGSIFGVWPCLDEGPPGDADLLGRTGREQVASAVSMYGPRTTLLFAIAPSSVFEITLVDNGRWTLSRQDIKLAPSKKVFAPGNLRASNDNGQYRSLINHWIDSRYTLRYTGGMVPDVYHMLMKGGGVFTNVSSTKAHAKLRLLYEVAPIGLIVECAGGHAIHEENDISVLEVKIEDMDQRLGVCFGSVDEVETYRQYMFSI
mmetsp:Transcript_39112/g.76291  ORF Transcript_39112/g.76291 Transcript_39112/m.76291 type:complete len:375 (+) Transcript_39112:189-1313(+)